MKGLLAIALLVAACAGAGATPITVYVTPAPGSTPFEGTPTTTDAPIPGDVTTSTEQVGSAIGITCGGDDCLQVTVVKAAFAAKYGSGYAIDEPTTRGHEFIGVYVKYRSLLSGTSYGPSDWQLFVNDEAISDQSFVFYGPKPELSYGNLPRGKSVSGWVFWEIPKAGRISIAYGASYSQAPVFEVVLRSK